jgi:hypothetical protein
MGWAALGAFRLTQPLLRRNGQHHQPFVEIDNPTKPFVKLPARVFWYLGGAILPVSNRPREVQPNNVTVCHVGPLGWRRWELWSSGSICHAATTQQLWFRSFQAANVPLDLTSCRRHGKEQLTQRRIERAV